MEPCLWVLLWFLLFYCSLQISMVLEANSGSTLKFILSVDGPGTIHGGSASAAAHYEQCLNQCGKLQQMTTMSNEFGRRGEMESDVLKKEAQFSALKYHLSHVTKQSCKKMNEIKCDHRKFNNQHRDYIKWQGHLKHWRQFLATVSFASTSRSQVSTLTGKCPPPLFSLSFSLH